MRMDGICMIYDLRVLTMAKINAKCSRLKSCNTLHSRRGKLRQLEDESLKRPKRDVFDRVFSYSKQRRLTAKKWCLYDGVNAYDQLRLFSNNCSSCGKMIPSNELVIKTAGNVYHIDCFNCIVCHCRLERGQDFALKDNKLYCKEHFKQMQNTKDHKQRNGNSSSEQSDNDTDSDCKKVTKRPRTVLTSHQQSIFQSSFEISSKPCRKVREELSRETGLSVRVVQVWFQNQRAKVKKLARRDRFKTYDFSGYKGKNKYGKKPKGDEDDLNGYNTPLPMGTPETLPLPPLSHFTLDCTPSHQFSPGIPNHLGNTMGFQFPSNVGQPKGTPHASSRAMERSPVTEYHISKNRWLSGLSNAS